MKTKDISRIIQTTVITAILMICPHCLMSQVLSPQDPFSTEALIGYHKSVGSRLLTRSAIETASKSLHETLSVSTKEMEAAADSLDRYYKCFDYIDILLGSARTVGTAYSTYISVKDKLGQIWEMTDLYLTKLAAHGNIVTTDTVIINIYEKLYNTLHNDVESLYQSFISLPFYVTGLNGAKLTATTTTLLAILSSINDNLKDIKYAVERGYYLLHRYIFIRMSYWKKALFRPHTTSEVCMSALDRWNKARYDALSGQIRKLESRW